MTPIRVLLLAVLFASVLGIAVVFVTGGHPAGNDPSDPSPVNLDVPYLLSLVDSLANHGELDSALCLSDLATKIAKSNHRDGDTLCVTALLRHMWVADKCGRRGAGDSLMHEAIALVEHDSSIPCGLLTKTLLAAAGHYLGPARFADSDRRSLLLAEAERYYDRALREAVKCSGEESPDMLGLLNELVSFYGYSINDLARRDSALNRIVSIGKGVDRLTPIDAFSVCFDIGYLMKLLSRYSEAESYLLKAAGYLDSSSAIPLERQVSSLSELGFVLEVQGKYDEAEEYLIRARGLALDSTVQNTTTYAILLKNLGNLHLIQGKYAEAEEDYLRSAKVRYSINTKDPNIAEALNNLGELYSLLQRYSDAEGCYKEAIGFRETYYGVDYPDLYHHLRGLGRIYIAQGRYADADTVLFRCLRICKKSLGSDHVHTALTEQTLGDYYRAVGQYGSAERSYLNALEVEKKRLGSSHWETGETLYRLGLLYESMWKHSKALSCFRDLMQGRHRFIADVFSYASEEQRLRYIDQYPVLLDPIFSFALRDSSSDSRKLALEMLVSGKAVVTDAVVADRRIMCCSDTGEARAQRDTLSRICDEISRLTVIGPAGLALEKHQRMLDSLLKAKDSVEEKISTYCSRFAVDRRVQRSGLSEIADRIPRDAVLWEYGVYRPYDFATVGNDTERKGKPRYLVFALDSDGHVDLRDLGDAETIDSLVLMSRDIIDESGSAIDVASRRLSEQSLSRVTSELYRLVSKPLESTLRGKANIIVSPDGQLNLIPFEIMRTTDGLYAVERYSFSYLTTARDLLDPQPVTNSAAKTMIIADPDFGEITDKQAQGEEEGSILCGARPFTELSSTRAEADSIGKLLRDKGELVISEYCGDAAEERVLKELTEAPRILHIATHGYFCAGADTNSLPVSRNPLLKTGLAFAGANYIVDPDVSEIPFDPDDGILTGLEVSNLDLFGTELVVLSACETGIGDIRNGEGVFGLRRAFRHAGVRNMLASLWRVPDAQTSDVMTGFYRRWLGGSTKSGAFREAVLDLIADHRAKYDSVALPYYWGGFELIGTPDPLTRDIVTISR
jgi:CHAT domain-containing protein/tetratricopeptide (TPR) repeat protein